ncbi:MAG TPA: DUF4159 domain-containing protein, partial [Vicinamibacterales bacterium]
MNRRAVRLGTGLRTYLRRPVPLVLAGLLLVASASSAQFGFGRGRQMVRDVPEGSYTGSFLFCRISFRNNPYGDGGGWDVDSPRADVNLSFRLSELTKTPISRDERGEIRHIVIRLTDPELYKCPFIMMTEVGAAYFDPAEAAALGDYLLKGGFLWADDFWGERAWDVWEGEIAKALPPGQFPIVDVPYEHELFHALYDVRELPQIPSIGFWIGTRGATSERVDSTVAHTRAIFDDHRRIMVLITHNTDF